MKKFSIKKLIVIIILLFVLVDLFILQHLSELPGKVSKNLVIDYGTSELFSEEEISNAVSTIISNFKTYRGFTLLKLYYDEEYHNNYVGNRIDWIYIRAEFKTGRNAMERGWDNNTIYDEGHFRLKKSDETGAWVFRDWGQF